MALGLPRTGGVGGGGGYRLSCATLVDQAATANVSRLATNLPGTVTFSKVSGSSNVSVASSTGQISLTSALGASGTATAVYRAQNTAGGAVERSIILTGGVALAALTLSANSFAQGAAAGTVIGSIGAKTAGSTLSVSPSDGRVSLVGNDGAGWNLVVGLTAWAPGQAVTYTITETLANATNSGRTTTFTVTANASAAGFNGLDYSQAQNLINWLV